MSFQRMSGRAAMVLTKPDKGETQRQHVFETMAKLYGWRTFVEIGVRKGQTGLFLLEHCHDLQWIGVDPYAVPEGGPHEPGFYDHRGEDRERQYRDVMAKLSPYGRRAKLIKETSAEAHDKVANGSVDCVFIDADHRYEFIKQDIELWLPKVAPDGWLTGHDSDWPSVRKAVAEFFPDALQLADAVWAVRQ